MENLASVDKIMVNAGQLTPCIKILRGIDVAARQQGAKFVVQLSFTYDDARGGVVTISPTDVLISKTRNIEGTDPMWVDVMAPPFTLPADPAVGSRFTCNAVITIATASGRAVECGVLDTQVLTPS